jgi:hypothetical protein
MSAMPSGSAVAPASAALSRTKSHGFLRIARHGVGPAAIYVLTYHRLEQTEFSQPHPVAAENSQALIDLLERIGVDFRQSEVRGALEDVLRFGSANIPGLWLSDEELLEKGLAES